MLLGWRRLQRPKDRRDEVRATTDRFGQEKVRLQRGRQDVSLRDEIGQAAAKATAANVAKSEITGRSKDLSVHDFLALVVGELCTLFPRRTRS